MKKLVFLFTMLFAVSIVMAQKTTNLWQNGNYNVAEVSQSSVFADNFIVASQTGQYNSLASYQIGWNNEIDLYQAGVGNEANMHQHTFDFGIIEHGLNTSTVKQNGSNNVANLNQREENGDANDGYFLGPIPENDRSTNVAHASQYGNQNSYKLNQGRETLQPQNESYLVQSGSYNDAVIIQKGIENLSEIKQNGDYGFASLTQNGSDPIIPVTTTFNNSFSWQTGTGNDLLVIQSGDLVDEHYAKSTQNGNNNNTTITQVGMTEQNIDAYQYGTGDKVVIRQIDTE